MNTAFGTGAAPGLAIGTVLWHNAPSQSPVPTAVTDVSAELARCETAIQQTIAQLGECSLSAASTGMEDAAAVFGVHQMMLEDEDFLAQVRQIIRESMVCAEYAVAIAGKKQEELFAAMDDDYMRERAADVRDITGRLLNMLSGGAVQRTKLPGPVILTAEDLTPSELLQLDQSNLLGIVTRRGSIHSHTCILARAAGIPAVVGAGNAVGPETSGQAAVLNGTTGQIILAPDEETLAHAQKQLDDQNTEHAWLAQLKNLPAQTLDGKIIKLYASISGPDGTAEALAHGAEGIGLFRTEFLFMDGQQPPDEEAQLQAYRTVAAAMANRPVIIRTLDIGADKQAPCFKLAKEENPAMGMRAIRLCLTSLEREFITQLRAIYRASAFGTLAILFPMITSVNEVTRLMALAANVREELIQEGKPIDKDLPLGIMIETPAAALISAELAAVVDFFSIGTNDLTQYTLAMDRQAAALAEFFDAYHPAVFHLIEKTVAAAHASGIRVGICGELAADTSLAAYFARIGVDELSVSSPALPVLKQAIRQADTRL